MEHTAYHLLIEINGLPLANVELIDVGNMESAVRRSLTFASRFPSFDGYKCTLLARDVTEVSREVIYTPTGE